MNTHVTQGPIFTVIVVAHDRREYLLDALKSISQQTLPKEFFEVIIVKNFVDRESDDYAKANNFELVLTDVGPVGAKMSIGIKGAKGKYIVFLEDDDLFVKSKLSSIYEYTRMREIGFIHNSYVLMNDAGETIPSPTNEADVYIEKADSFLDTCKRHGLKSNDFALSSCIAILKAIVTPYLVELSYIESAPDLFLLFSFLCSPFSGAYMKERLTKYRLHQSQSNRSAEDAEFINRNIEIRQSWISDYAIMKGIFVSGETHKLAGYFLRYNILFSLVLQNIRNPRKKFELSLSMIWNTKAFQFYPSMKLILLAILSIISPKMSHKYYLGYRKKSYASTFHNLDS